MSDPTAIHQPGLDARVLVKIGLAIITCLSLILGVAVAVIFGQITNARVELGFVETSLSALSDRLGRIEKAVDETRASLERPARDERQTVKVTPVTPVTPATPATPATPNVVAGFYVTQQEAEFIREFLKVPPKSAATAKMALWVRVPAQATKPLPDGLVAKLEKLRGLRYAVDANNAIALIEPSINIVIALI